MRWAAVLNVLLLVTSDPLAKPYPLHCSRATNMPSRAFPTRTPWQVKHWVLLLLTSLSRCSPQSAVQAHSLLWEEWWWFLLGLALTVHPNWMAGSMLSGYQIVNVGGEIDLGSNAGSDHFSSRYPLRKRVVFRNCSLFLCNVGIIMSSMGQVLCVCENKR